MSLLDNMINEMAAVKRGKRKDFNPLVFDETPPSPAKPGQPPPPPGGPINVAPQQQQKPEDTENPPESETPIEPGEDQDDTEGSGKGDGEEEDSNETGDDPFEIESNTGAFDKMVKEGTFDEHLPNATDGSEKELMRKVLAETEAHYRQRQQSNGGGNSGMDVVSRVREALKAEFNLDAIKDRLAKYKRLLAEDIDKEKTFTGAAFGPRYGSTIMSRNTKQPADNNPNSAICFFVADVSGSISGKDYQLITGYMNSIYNQFESGTPIKGEMFLVEWSDRVLAPVRKYKGQQTIRARSKLEGKKPESYEQLAKLRTGGGNEINSLFKFFDDNFYREINGKPNFVFNPDDPVFKYDPNNAKRNDEEREKLGDEKFKMKPMQPVKLSLSGSGFKASSGEAHPIEVQPGRLIIKEPKMSNAPFLIVYTDGMWDPLKYKSKLWAGAPGNIVWICTTKQGISIVAPQNFLYHDLWGDKL
jgi:hypothetical protein